MDISSLKNKYRTLKQYRDLPEEELERVVRLKATRKELDIEGQFLDAKEKKVAKELMGKYLEDYSVETVSDRNTLKQLIYLEILGFRMQGMANELHAKDRVVPTQLMASIHNNINEILALKDKLGLTGSTKEQVDSFKHIDLLKKKFRRWMDENQGSRTMVCPHCGKMCLLRIRVDKYESSKHPYFVDRVLYNKKLVELYLQNKITKTDLSEILECSGDYIEWLISKWHTNPHCQEKEKEYKDEGR